MGLGDTFVWYEYLSDDGDTYGIKLSAKVAQAGGFSSEVSPSEIQIWPYGPKNLRHVLGKASNGHRTRLPIASAANALYMSGGSFTISPTDYEVEGQIGERRAYNSVA